MLEATILKYLLTRDNYDKYYYHIRRLTLEPEVSKLFGLLPTFFEASDGSECSLQELKALFNLEYPSIKDPEVYTGLFEQIESSDLGDAVLGKIVSKLVYKDTTNLIIQACMPVLSNADKGEALDSVRELLDKHDKLLSPEATEQEFMEDNLDLLLEAKVRCPGLKWRLNGLNNYIGELRRGRSGHIFARPNTGKTSFLLSEMSYWAQQLEGDDIGIWVNNEEDGQTLRLRWIAAVTGWPPHAIDAQPQRAMALFEKLCGGKVKLYDRPGATQQDIEQLFKKHRPRFAVIDLGDKVKTPKLSKLGETQRLTELYSEYREWAKIYQMDILTTGQAHADATGKMWLRDSWMDNSKTGKPGELDYAIGIGNTDIIYYKDMRRYIAVCKNKGPQGTFVSMLDPDKARYSD